MNWHNSFFSFIFSLCFSSLVFAGEFDVYLSSNLYTRLGISQKATEAEIKAAYRRLALKLHPDRNHGKEKEVLEPFQKIQEAYDILSDSMKRSKYDSAFNLNASAANVKMEKWMEDGFDFRVARDEILQLVQKHPKLQDLADYVLNYWILKNIPEEAQKRTKEEMDKVPMSVRLATRDAWVKRGGKYYDPSDPNFVPKGVYWAFPQPFYLWPTDIAIVKLVIKTENPFLLKQVVISMLSVPGWEKHEDLLLGIISKNNKFVNFGIAEFFYHPQWVNKRGAKVLSKLIELGYSDAAVMSLALAGGMPFDNSKGTINYSKAWYVVREGRELMKQLILTANQNTLDSIDSLLLESDSSPWVIALRKLPEFRNLQYISTAQLKIALHAANKNTVKLTSPQIQNVSCAKSFRRLNKN